MGLRRIRKGVRRGPRVDGTTTAVSFFAMGVVAAETCGAAHLDGFGRLRPGVGATGLSLGRSKAPRLSEVTSRIFRGRFFHLWGCWPAALANPVRAAAESQGPCESREGPRIPDHLACLDGQTPSENTDNTEERVVSSRTAPARHQGVRARWRNSKRRDDLARCGGGHLGWLFPQSGQHLPFPLRNARVEVGRLVMEG